MELSDLELRKIGNTIQLSGALYSGEGKHFMCFFPEEGPDQDRHEEVIYLKMNREDWVKFITQTDLMETEILKHYEDGTFVKAIVRKSQRQVEQSIYWKVFRRDGYACRYCGKNDVPLTVDHIVLWEAGGPSIEANLTSACKKCNRTRGNMTYPDWLASGYYQRISQALTDEQRQDNIRLVETLDKIPRVVHKRSR